MTSSIKAVVNDEGSETSPSAWAAVIGAIIVVVLVAVVAIFYLGVTRKKRKVELYYKDFDIGMNENEVKGGSLDDDPDWDDLL